MWPFKKKKVKHDKSLDDMFPVVRHFIGKIKDKIIQHDAIKNEGVNTEHFPHIVVIRTICIDEKIRISYPIERWVPEGFQYADRNQVYLYLDNVNCQLSLYEENFLYLACCEYEKEKKRRYKELEENKKNAVIDEIEKWVD